MTSNTSTLNAGAPGIEPTNEDLDALDQHGFLILPNILPLDRVAMMNDVLDMLLVREGDRAGIEMHQEAGTERLADLPCKDTIFDVCFSTPVVLSAVQHVLGDYLLSELVSRFALPGFGWQALHADAHKDEGGNFTSCNTFWLLDDFTEENGATRVVPGSHKLGIPSLPDPLAPHPDEIQVVASAGSVVIFNAHLWHGGALNRSQQRRRAISAFYVRRDQPANVGQRLDTATIARLTPAERALFGVSGPAQ